MDPASSATHVQHKKQDDDLGKAVDKRDVKPVVKTLNRVPRMLCSHFIHMSDLHTHCPRRCLCKLTSACNAPHPCSLHMNRMLVGSKRCAARVQIIHHVAVVAMQVSSVYLKSPPEKQLSQARQDSSQLAI